MMFHTERRNLFAVSGALVVVLVLSALAVNRDSASVPDNDHRYLQWWSPSSWVSSSPSSWFPSIPTVISAVVPFYKPNEYALHSIDAFDMPVLCTDPNRLGCSAENTISFTAEANPAPNQFRYQNTGPDQLKGVFWMQQPVLANVFAFDDLVNFDNTDLVSFAQTNHGAGVQTGQLERDGNGYDYVMRQLGDHSWSRSVNAPSNFGSDADLLYLYKLTDGSLLNPFRFEITPNFKALFNCVRFNFGQLTNVFSRIEMYLIQDNLNPIKVRYSGSVVWKRRTTFTLVNQNEYLMVQVIDGNGQPIFPAWSEFIANIPTTIVPGLRQDRLDDRISC